MQNQHRINYQTSYFGNTVLYVVESVGSIADNVNGLAKLPILKTKLRIKTLYGNFAKPML